MVFKNTKRENFPSILHGFLTLTEISKIKKDENVKFLLSNNQELTSSLYIRLHNAYLEIEELYDVFTLIMGGKNLPELNKNITEGLKHNRQKPYLSFTSESLETLLLTGEIEMNFGYLDEHKEDITLSSKISKIFHNYDISHQVQATNRLVITEPWTKNPMQEPFLFTSENSSWKNIEWKSEQYNYRERVTRWGGRPTPIWGSGKCITDVDGLTNYFFMAQTVLPDGRIAFIYSDPDALINGDFEKYEESYPLYGKTPFYQRKLNPHISDTYDFVLIEGEPLPNWLKVSEGQQEIISEVAYIPVGTLPSTPAWMCYEDYPEDTSIFLAQFPSAFQEGKTNWELNTAYIWWDGTNSARITWQDIDTTISQIEKLDWITRSRIKQKTLLY